MGLYRSLGGTIRVRVTSGDVSGLLDRLRLADIPVFAVQPEEELSISFSLSRKMLPRIKMICEKRGDSLTIIRREGLYWVGRKLLMRPVLLVGLLLLIIWMLWMPTHVFFVKVEGNSVVPARLILEAAEENGIRFGASRRQVRSERVKNALMEAVPQLQWAGVNTYGCVAVISVREKTATNTKEAETGISSIVSSCDAIVRSVTATEGNLLCRVGQAVRAGEILISGYTDCGLTIQATRAQGEIYGWTEHTLTVFAPTIYEKKGECLQKSTAYSLILGKKRINLWKGSGISGSSCDRIYEEYTLTLPGGFSLPVTLVRETVTAYTTAATEYAPEEMLGEFAEEYLLTQLIAGTVEGREEQFSSRDEVMVLDVCFICTEMIGRQKAEEIDIHG